MSLTGARNGDGKTDIAMFRPSNGTWYEVDNGSGNPRTLISAWGTTGDIPLAKPTTS